MTDAAQVGIAWSPPAPGERSELPGHRCKVGQILQLTWGTPVFARSGPSHRTISRKLPPYTLISALTRAREASGGNNRETRRLLINRPSLCLKEVRFQKDVYAPTIGLCKDPMMIQSKKPSNTDF